VETETNQREWPIGNVRWSHTFSTGAFTLVAVGTAFRHREGTSVQANPGGQPALTNITSSSLTPDVQFGLRNGLTVSLGLSALNQDNLSNGNQTRLDQNDITGALNYSFRLPRSIARTRKQVRSSLTVLQTAAKTCLEQGAATDCILISDVRRRELRGGLDTDLLQTLSGGLQVGYSLNDVRHLSRRTSQISIIASFQLSLFAGDYR
jgi:hypothetical protein